MDFRLLGPFEVIYDDGTALDVGTGRPRALLALLALRANELLTSDRLIEELWGEPAPATAQKMLHNQVSTLRQVLGRNGRLETVGSAYRLNLGPEERDVDRFEALVARGELREALDLWRGSPLADLAFEPFAQAEIARLEERRWAAFEAWADAELGRGLHGALIAELEAAVAQQPLRERLHGLLMLALYRAGRQADALEAYRRARRTLVEEVGLEPGPELRALQEMILAQVPAPAVCPYMGLSAFDAAHAGYFFGRERLTAELVARLVGAPLLAVVGPSGSGKSSAVRAGLLPALASGVLPGSERWSIRVVRPHDGLPPADLLFVDQFEEAFALDGYLDALVAYPGQVVIALRADFYGRCAGHEELARLVAANQVLVGPLRRDELRRAIEEPARRVGLSVEPALTEALIADVLDEPGGLPLLSAALLEQWREREGHVLRHAAYERTGGVRGAVGRLAERTYAGLSERERADARRILLRLAGEGDVRVRMPLDELPDVSVLAESRLVTVDAGSVEVAHEALLREWPRLRGWLDEDAEGRRVHRRLTEAARESDGDASELYRGARLAAALDWAGTHADELSPAERSFLDASRVATERVNRRLRVLVATFAVLLAAALAAGVVALDQRGGARRAALTADAERLGAEAINEDHLDRALALARTGVALDDTPATRGHLLSVLERNPAAVGEVVTGWALFGVAFSPDGRLLAIGDENGRLMVYDARTRVPVAPPYSVPGGLIQVLHFSPDGRRLAVSSVNPGDPARPLADVIDPLTGRRLLRIELPPQRVSDPFTVGDVSFLPDGYAVLASTPGGPSSLLYRLDGRGTITGRLALGKAASYPTMSAADGHVFVTSAGDARTWELDPERLRMLRTFPAGDEIGRVSPDGRRYALGGPGGRVRMIDLASGAVRTFPPKHRADISALAFTPDSRTLVTGDNDGRIFAWRGTAAVPLPGHTSRVGRLQVSPDGRTLLSIGDRRAILWDLTGARRVIRSFSAGPDFPAAIDTPRGLAPSPDGRTLAVTEGDGSVELVDTTSLQRRAVVKALDHTALSVAYSPNGGLLAVAGAGRRVTLWDARTLAPRGELRGLAVDSQALAFSPDGHWLAAAEVANDVPVQPIRVWDVRTGRLTAFRARGLSNLLAFSPDGRWLASAAAAGTEVFDAATGHLVTRIHSGADPRSVAFSPGGGQLFIGQYDGRGRLYSTHGWRPIGRFFEGHSARLTFAAFTADGRTLATSGGDGTVALWDVATQRPIGSPLALAPDAYASVAISGSHVFAVSITGPALRLDISRASWERQACLVAGHDLNAQEWADALPGRPQTPVCGAVTGG